MRRVQKKIYILLIKILSLHSLSAGKTNVTLKLAFANELTTHNTTYRNIRVNSCFDKVCGIHRTWSHGFSSTLPRLRTKNKLKSFVSFHNIFTYRLTKVFLLADYTHLNNLVMADSYVKQTLPVLYKKKYHCKSLMYIWCSLSSRPLFKCLLPWLST